MGTGMALLLGFCIGFPIALLNIIFIENMFEDQDLGNEYPPEGDEHG